jgi:hypothetical protein
MKMQTPPYGTTDDRNKDANKSRRPVNVSTATNGMSFTPNTSKGGKGSSAEMSLERAQGYVNQYFPETTQGLSQRELARNEALSNEAASYRNGEQPASQQGQGYQSQQDQHPEEWPQAQRDQMAYYQGQLWALQDAGRAPEGAHLFDVNTNQPSEQRAWEQGQDSVQAMLMQERWANDTAFQQVASKEPMTLPTDQLSKQGQEVSAVSYSHDGMELKHSYRVDGASIVHTAPNGDEQKMTVAESKVHQAERQERVTRNTADALEGMKANPNVSFRQGEHTFSVQGKHIVRTDLEGNKQSMPLAKFEANLRERQSQAAEAVKTAQTDLQKERKEHASIKDALANAPDNGKQPTVTTKDKFGPTTWTLDKNGELQGQPNKFKAAEKTAEQSEAKGVVNSADIDNMTPAQAKAELQAHNAFVAQQKGTDLNAATDRFKAGEAERKDAKAANSIGQKTIVERLREKGEGGTLENKKTGEVYSLQGDNLVRHDKDNNVTLDMPADEAHKAQKEQMEAKAAEREKEQTK